MEPVNATDAGEKNSAWELPSQLEAVSPLKASRSKGKVLPKRLMDVMKHEFLLPEFHDVSVRSLISSGLMMRARVWAQTITNASWVTAFLLILTVWSCFAPDFDNWLGSKQSQVPVKGVTTAVMIIFLLEMVLQLLASRFYWDYVFSLRFGLDVISVISMLADTVILDGNLQGTSSLIAGRSAKATRVLKITKSLRSLRALRGVRAITYLLARLGGKQRAELRRILDKKLLRVFNLVDDDLDGYIDAPSASACIDCIGDMVRGNLDKLATRDPSVTSDLTEQELMSQALGDNKVHPEDVPPQEASPTGSPTQSPREGKVSKDKTSADFLEMVYSKKDLLYQLQVICKRKMFERTDISTLIAKSAEQIGIKVAIAVLILLFALSFVNNGAVDSSIDYGLMGLQTQMQKLNITPAAGQPVPAFIQKQVKLWTGGSEDPQLPGRRILYLELGRQVYCNDFSSAGPPCADVAGRVWGANYSDVINDQVMSSKYRTQDLDISSLAAQDGTSVAMVVTNIQAQVQLQACMSLLNLLLTILIILGGIVGMSLDVSRFNQGLFKPVIELADDVEGIVDNQAVVLQPPKEQATDKEELLAKGFARLRNGIRSWAKYVPWPVVWCLLADNEDSNIEMSEKEVSMYFSDIAGFTTIVEKLTPLESLKLLKRYFRDMGSIIDDNEGIVIEFIGDAIFAVYGAPKSQPQHPKFALRAAVAMQRARYSINEWCVKHKLPEIGFRSGVHTGKVFVGSMGFNMRVKYGAVGEDSEIPAKLEETNKTYSTKILISSHTFKRVKEEDFLMRPVDLVHLTERASRGPELVYEVLDRLPEDPSAPQLRKALKLHGEAYQSYRAMDFERAGKQFAEVGVLMKEITGEEDPVSSMFHKRCATYQKDPPLPGWDGVWDR